MKNIYYDYANILDYNEHKFRNRVGSGMGLYHYLIYVCTLGKDLPELLPRWAARIFDRCYPVITTKLEPECESIDRVKVLEDEMMHPQMGVCIEDYDPDQYVFALTNEKRRVLRQLKDVSKNNDSSLLKKEIHCIDAVLNDLENHVDRNKSRIEHFYDMFKSATRNQSLDRLIDLIEDFTGIASGSLKFEIGWLYE